MSRQQDYLDQQLIRKANISGIGPTWIATLSANGIESALDVRSGMGVPGIGSTFESKLIGWKQRVEAGFRFNPGIGIPRRELHKLDVKILEIRQNLETELRAGSQLLSSVGIKFSHQFSQVQGRISGLVQQ